MLAVDDAWENFINNTSPNNIINQEEKEETEKLNEVDMQDFGINAKLPVFK